jgi:hypothetical protein
MGVLDVAAEGAGRYVVWGVIQISVANLIIVGIMLGLFVLALLVPFPGRHRNESEKRS